MYKRRLSCCCLWKQVGEGWSRSPCYNSTQRKQQEQQQQQQKLTVWCIFKRLNFVDVFEVHRCWLFWRVLIAFAFTLLGTTVLEPDLKLIFRNLSVSLSNSLCLKHKRMYVSVLVVKRSVKAIVRLIYTVCSGHNRVSPGEKSTKDRRCCLP